MRALPFPVRKKPAVAEKALAEKRANTTPDTKPALSPGKKKLKVQAPQSHSLVLTKPLLALAGSPAPARRSEQEKTINHLPDEVLVHVLSYLPRFSDNLAARLVSRRWRDAAKDMSVVRNYFKLGDPWKDNEKFYHALARPVSEHVGWLAVQPALRAEMRVILVAWLTEVHHEFHLNPKTLFLAISYLDRLLLARPAIPRSMFQLYGLTCLWIASKFEDVYTNSIQDLVWICDDAYTRIDFEMAEQEILRLLGWRLAQVTSVCFVDAMLEEGAVDLQGRQVVWQGADERQRARLVAHMLCEASLVDYSSLRRFSPSLIAVAALAVAVATVHNRPADEEFAFNRNRRPWEAHLPTMLSSAWARQQVGQESQPAIQVAVEWLHETHGRLATFAPVVFEKYRARDKLAVADLPPLAETVMFV